MKRLTFFLVALFLATTALWAYGFKSGDLYYRITRDGTATVTYENYTLWSEETNYSNISQDITIPENITYNNVSYRVTNIDDLAFANCTNLKSIIFPNSITYIGDYAFNNCVNLSNITMGDAITHIGTMAFSNTPWKQNLPDGLLYIGKVLYAYIGNMSNNTRIVVKDGTTQIGECAFEGCSNLTSITLPNTITNIEAYAFAGCVGLTSLTIPNSVKNIGVWVILQAEKWVVCLYGSFCRLGKWWYKLPLKISLLGIA